MPGARATIRPIMTTPSHTISRVPNQGAKPQLEVLKVSATSKPVAVAGAIAGVVRTQQRVEVQAIGAGAINQAIKAIAISRGYVAPGGPDLAVLITCTVRANAEQKVYGKFRELVPWKRQRHGRAIALTGCMAVEHGEALLQRLPEVDYVFDVREPDGFLAKLQALHGADLDGPVTLPASDRVSAFVSVMGGCNEMCTYCIVPFVRGREQSRPMRDVVEHVSRLVGQGVRDVTLLGQNVNSYRDPDGGGRLPELLAAVDAVSGLWRLRFLTSHPRNATPALFEAMRDLPTVCE